MKTEEIIFMVFVGIIMLGIPLVFWMIHNENKRQKEEEQRLWEIRRKNRRSNQ